MLSTFDDVLGLAVELRAALRPLAKAADGKVSVTCTHAGHVPLLRVAFTIPGGIFNTMGASRYTEAAMALAEAAHAQIVPHHRDNSMPEADHCDVNFFYRVKVNGFSLGRKTTP